MKKRQQSDEWNQTAGQYEYLEKLVRPGIRNLLGLVADLLPFARSAATQHIQPGQPQQNAYVERFNRTVRYEWLAQYLFDSIDEIQLYATQWLWSYNHERPNMALGGFTPNQRLAMAA
jgi:transposase InsO family protein